MGISKTEKNYVLFNRFRFDDCLYHDKYGKLRQSILYFFMYTAVYRYLFLNYTLNQPYSSQKIKHVLLISLIFINQQRDQK